MPRDSLRVQRVQVRTAVPLASRIGLAARLEDALRTATQPIGWRGRFVLIRRLSLRIGNEAPAHALARALELHWQTVATQMQPGTMADAGAAAVWFDDEPAARLALISRLADGRDVSGWFWRRLLGEVAAAPAVPAIAALLAAPWRDTRPTPYERARLLADVCRAMGAIERIEQVVMRLEPQTLQVLLPPPWLAPNAAALRAAKSSPRPPASPGPANLTGADHIDAVELLRAAALQFAAAALATAPGSMPEINVVARLSRQDSVSSPRHRSASAAAPPAASNALDGISTRWAGFFLALNLFKRIDAGPATATAAVRWLRAIAAHLRVAADDRLHVLFDQLDATVDAEADQPDDRDLVPLHALRWRCLQLTRCPLRRVLARSGCIHLTRTHLTVVLRLADVRLAVRKAGLDVDPGWLPLLGRVVRFEYD